MVFARLSGSYCARTLCAVCVALASVACTKEPVTLGAYDYPAPAIAAATQCALGAKSSGAGAFDDERLASGIRYSVRTPANYDPRVAHRLLVVYAAAGHNRFESEAFLGFTERATRLGYVVTYADHRRLSIPTLNELATLSSVVAGKWCIDLDHIYLSGHSDGGTAAAAMAFRSDDGLQPAGIAASAAGLNGEHLADVACPAPLRVMLMHNRDDRLFPGFGRAHSAWWARCQGCVGSNEDIATPCVDYQHCSGALRFCEGAGGHRKWPGLNEGIFEFFADDNERP